MQTVRSGFSGGRDEALDVGLASVFGLAFGLVGALGRALGAESDGAVALSIALGAASGFGVDPGVELASSVVAPAFTGFLVPAFAGGVFSGVHPIAKTAAVATVMARIR